ncbi:exodeoxyribonuclease VII large subunit [Gynuella sunshinyii]|uniref:Exodeoxyribonuclease 7 large subunit n=1 Tax=Gynuella sunshinyii YC6258 TaxID=1445510 RepID=A0A0C5VIJ9_9GAMM|nr:exodeoxyribonuclease VII large subunit [Gynuella sunshinyii]AJQ94497.1 exonuclease VII, large subunit [Gynuella sunshinyii YC6258]
MTGQQPPHSETFATAPPQALSVTQLNHQIRFLLETHYGSIAVEGEISNLAKPASGHIYFTLKDSKAQIRVAWFKSSVGRYIPKHGDSVIVSGRLSLYEPRGDYQLIASSVRPAGEGALQQAFLALKEKLELEGLFDPGKKQPLPSRITRIGVITSSTGAAIQDILTVLKRRFPAIEVLIYPVAVQGENAAPQICKAITLANEHASADVLIVGRGGGSLEDLWPFNEESVARAIAASQIPVVSAVGHEIDFTIADFVADVRAPTPSAAAELLSPDQQEYMQTLDQYESILWRAMGKILQEKSMIVEHLHKRLRHPGQLLTEQNRRLDNLQEKLARAIRQSLYQSNQMLILQHQRLMSHTPDETLNQLKKELNRTHNSLLQAIRLIIQKRSEALRANARELNAVSPLATLERGYSITLSQQQTAITSLSQVEVGDVIETRLHQGRVLSKVEKKLNG